MNASRAVQETAGKCLMPQIVKTWSMFPWNGRKGLIKSIIASHTEPVHFQTFFKQFSKIYEQF